MSEMVTKPIAAAELVGFAKSSTHPTTDPLRMKEPRVRCHLAPLAETSW
jgi:hypothetical protein